jgi:hypothetical protein
VEGLPTTNISEGRAAVKLVNKRSADKAAHVARDRAAASAGEDARVADDGGLTETDSGENLSEGQA